MTLNWNTVANDCRVANRSKGGLVYDIPWMETFSALLAICAGNSPVTGAFPVTWSFDVFFDLRLNKRLSKQSRGWWFETPSRPLWRHCNAVICKRTFEYYMYHVMNKPHSTKPLPEKSFTKCSSYQQCFNGYQFFHHASFFTT